MLRTGLFWQFLLDLALFLTFNWFGGGDVTVPDKHLDGFADLVGEAVDFSTEDFEGAAGLGLFLKSQCVAAVGVGVDDKLLFEIEVHVFGLVVYEGQVVGLGPEEAGLEGGQLLDENVLGGGDGAVLALEVGEQRFDEIVVFIEEVDAGVGIEAVLESVGGDAALADLGSGTCGLLRVGAIGGDLGLGCHDGVSFFLLLICGACRDREVSRAVGANLARDSRKPRFYSGFRSENS